MKNKRIIEMNNIGLRDNAIRIVSTLPDLIEVDGLKIQRENLLTALSEPATHVLDRKSDNILKCPPKLARAVLRRLGITPPKWDMLFDTRESFRKTSRIPIREYGLMILKNTLSE